MSLYDAFVGLFTPPFPTSISEAAERWADALQPYVSQEIAFADLETPGGTINGSNLVFTLAHAPSPAASLHLFLNGVLLLPTSQYTLSGSTITLSSDFTPYAGSTLRASYRH